MGGGAEEARRSLGFWGRGGHVGLSEDVELEALDPRTAVAVILGGGAGTRLFPLTKRRAKPAVPSGGAYGLIDVPMSNCINSAISKVNGVAFGDGFVEVLAATQTPGSEGKRWFQGTADAVRQFDCFFDVRFSLVYQM
ncbi:hypothetical protein GUJ93_ZPchr0003g17732 [Zizania palustris]|uniref:glucose-1-phosphate adenylyltransferase n=1 Tax=Zizania palustris TaxID=103762 RepID=A0A8J5VJR4_ZIZPA|nr:hypothetical protein GUJ93_ZPchr0003g17732 [Zizania palustris]